MSKYTTEVRFICENAAGYDESQGYQSVESVIQAAIPKVFDFDFPVFDPSYRNVLATKILRHYYTREIGFETVGLWKLKLSTALNEIMPFYNQLYESELIKFNPMYDTDLRTTNVGQKDSTTNGTEDRTTLNTTEASSTNGETIRTAGTAVSTETGTITGSESGDKTIDESSDSNRAEADRLHEMNSSSGTSTAGREYSDSDESTGATSGTSKTETESSQADQRTSATASNSSDSDSKVHWDMYSDTPQGQLSGVEDGDYLTNARKITDTDTRSGKNSGTGTETGSQEGSTTATGSEESTTFSSGTKEGSSSETTARAESGDRRSEADKTATEASTRTSTESGSSTSSSNTTTKGTEVTAGETSRDGSARDSSTASGLETANRADRFNSTESYVLHVIGKNAGTSYSKMLMEFRETFLNIDLEIINALNDLFMLVW